ncbi:glutaminase GtaA [Thozetella sp. PMI_491]|nr:glutaminase GtaA [Thozetella sp. PMI_491]
MACAQRRYFNASTGDSSAPVYSPARPPSVPLAVRSPYLSAWSTTAGGGTLNSNNVRFWNGDSLGWEGIVVVDGIAYEYLGTGSRNLPVLPNVRSATPKNVRYDSQYSNFTFEAGGVKIAASFFSPVTPKDICRTSIPLSYLTTAVESSDGRPHSVQFYSDVNAAWISRDGGRTIAWDLNQGGQSVTNISSANGLYSWIAHMRDPNILSENGDFPEWGSLSYTTSAMGARNFTFQSGYSTDVRYYFAQNRTLKNLVDRSYRGWADREVVFAYSHDAGNVTQASVRYTIGSIQDPIMRYMTPAGIVPLRPWWQKCYGDINALINFHWNDFDTVRALGGQFESQLRGDIEEVTVPDVPEAQSYYSIVALSARQVMHAYVYAIPHSTSTGNTSYNDPLMFQKEISSDGNVNTVDVLFPALPFFLWANPEMLRYTLQPLYENQEGGFYPRGYCMHDIGSSFPSAIGHIDGRDEYMPLEESGNFIIMSYAYYKFSGNSAWLSSHYELLKQFATYLTQFSLLPEGQLSTDDFAGTLVNQTNLAIKGIVGLQAMAAVARVAGKTDDAARFAATAKDYYAKWESYGIDPKRSHALLSYEWESSWGLLYNIYPDKLLNLGIVNASVYSMQSSFYSTVSQDFGVPLDSRHHYTKSDWMIWTAATCSADMRRIFVNSLAYWLNSTSTDQPFSDLFEVIDTGGYPSVPNSIVFKARPTVGGHFALLALLRAE